MALPTLSSRYGPLRIEERWQNRHLHNQNHNKRWNDVVRYHSENALRASWSSRQARLRDDTEDSVSRCSESSRKINKDIHYRRQRLGSILEKEKHDLEKELHQLKISISNLDLLKDKTEELRSARQEKNRKIAEEKLYQHWQMNNHDLRALDKELHQEDVKDTWKFQSRHKSVLREEEKENERLFANEYEEERKKSMNNLKKIEQERRKAEKERAEVLLLQMKDLEERAKESERLQAEEARLLREKLKLEKMEEERNDIKKQAEQKELGFFLHRQYKAQMRKRAREIQEELDLDRQILGKILEEQKREDVLKSARQEKAKQDVSWMKKVMEQQLKLEKEREAELDLMYREEARQVWNKQEGVWKKEREAREQLVRDVLDERASQLAEKLEENKRKQQDLLKERSDLIKAMDAAKRSSEHDKNAEEHLKVQQRDDLEKQVTSRREKTARQLSEELEELRAEKEAERGYREFLESEAKTRRTVGYQPKQYGRRRIAWD